MRVHWQVYNGAMENIRLAGQQRDVLKILTFDGPSERTEVGTLLTLLTY